MKKTPLKSGAKLYSVEQVQAIEQAYARQSEGGTYPLMHAAGQFCYQILSQLWPEAKNILILCGKGNNAGDGYIIANLAVEDDHKVTLCDFGLSDTLKGDALKAREALNVLQVQFIQWQKINFDNYDVIVDAMLGTGIKGKVREPFASVIEQINQSHLPILSVDVPSGLEADTGHVSNLAVNASATATLVGYKKGLFTGVAANHIGQLFFSDLTVPESCYQQVESDLKAENWQTLKNQIKPRSPASHKGSHGHGLVIGGNSGMTGAAILAATACARTGAGLTSAWMKDGAASLNSYCPEVMARNINEELVNNLLSKSVDFDAIVVGPGLGKDEWAQLILRFVIESKLDIPQVWDADALNWLAENPNKDSNRILTPHPGESARLLGVSTESINQDRFKSANEIAKQYGGVCVLKGAGTIISDGFDLSDESGRQVVCAVGNPGMASGGMGDVLAGIIGSLLAQGFSLFDAAKIGVCIHGEAADLAAGEKNLYRGMLASDLIKFIPQLVNP